MSGYFPLAKVAESFCSRSSVVEAPEDTLIVTLGCAKFFIVLSNVSAGSV